MKNDRSPESIARNESFWRQLRGEYATATADFIQLEFGWYHPCAQVVLDKQFETMRTVQARGSHYKRGEMHADREAARAELARVAGAGADEVVVTRSSTESLNLVIQGMPLPPGAGIVYGDQDYPSVVQALEQRAARDELKLQLAQVPLDPASDDEVLAAYTAALTRETRAIVITHVSNHSGQVLPVAKLCALGRALGLQVIVDAAHSFAQIDFSVAELDCDFLAASLHKWLGAPLGTGLLYVRRECIEALTPLFADTQIARHDIRKLEQFGNGEDGVYLGLIEAIRWHERLGTAVKGARLRFLQRRWTAAARDLPGIRVLTPEGSDRHAAIGVFAVAGMDPALVVKRLWEVHRIFVNIVDHPRVRGVRVTPGLPTTVEEIDSLIQALRDFSALASAGKIGH